MKCKNCANLIPDQSTFCPYCGVSLEQTQAQPSADASQLAAPHTSTAQQLASLSAKAKGKIRICPKCGTLLSKKEKICSVCGEIMPKPKKAHKAKTAIISMSVVICLLLCSTVYFMLEMFQGNRAIDELREENKDLKAEVTDLESEVKYYCDKAKSNQSKINTLEQKIKDLEKQLHPWYSEGSGQYASPAYKTRW